VTSQDTYRRVLDAAEDLFFSNGITGTGVDMVANQANVAIATLYKYSGNKGNLLREVLARRLNLWVDHWDAAIAAARTPDDRLMAIFDAYETFRATARPTQWCTFLATSSELSPATEPDEVRALVERDTQLILDRLQTLSADVAVPDPSALAAGILLIYNGLLASLLRGAPSDPLVTARHLARSLITSSRSGPADRG
jgi:AcrR family transcriptional regulator